LPNVVDGTEHVRSNPQQLGDLRCLHLRDRIRVGGIGEREHLRHAGDLRGIGRTPAGSAASTTISMESGFSACAAETHLAVDALSLPSRCSATISTLLITAAP
jgi:hypothetical protein